MRKILYVNACVKREIDSRTNRLAQAYLKKCLESRECTLSTVTLEELVLSPLTGASLAEREKAIAAKDFTGSTFALVGNYDAGVIRLTRDGRLRHSEQV